MTEAEARKLFDQRVEARVLLKEMRDRKAAFRSGFRLTQLEAIQRALPGRGAHGVFRHTLGELIEYLKASRFISTMLGGTLQITNLGEAEVLRTLQSHPEFPKLAREPNFRVMAQNESGKPNAGSARSMTAMMMARPSAEELNVARRIVPRSVTKPAFGDAVLRTSDVKAVLDKKK